MNQIPSYSDLKQKDKSKREVRERKLSIRKEKGQEKMIFNDLSF